MNHYPVDCWIQFEVCLNRVVKDTKLNVSIMGQTTLITKFTQIESFHYSNSDSMNNIIQKIMA